MSINAREASAYTGRPAAKGRIRSVAAAMLLGVGCIGLIIGLPGMLQSWDSRAQLLAFVLVPTVSAVIVLQAIPRFARAILLWAVPFVSFALTATFIGMAVFGGTQEPSEGSLGIALVFAAHAACVIVAVCWARQLNAAPPDLRAKGSEALRLLTVPLVFGVFLAVLPDVLGDEFFVPFLSALLLGSLVIVLGSGYTSAVSAREEWQRMKASKSTTSSVRQETAAAGPLRVEHWWGLAFIAIVLGLRSVGARRSP